MEKSEEHTKKESIRPHYPPHYPRAWTSKRLGDTGVIPSYDLAPNGRIFGLLGADVADGGSGLVLVTDFVALLAERPMGR